MTATEAELIAAIAAAPDDDAGFLVYADFLQSRGDPRGELIALMHAGDGKRADQLLRANHTALVGKLASSSIKLESWRLGFVDHLRLIADDERHALALLDVVASHPSCRFVRKLEVLIIGKRRSYAGVEARLVELAWPPALRDVTFGKSGDHVPSPAFREAFPLVATAATRGWPEITAAITAIRRAAPLLPAGGLPTLAVPLEPAALVRGLAAEIHNKMALGLVARLHEDCTPDALDGFAAALVDRWREAGGNAREAWVNDAASVLGGARTARSVAIGLGDVSPARASQVIDSLARLRTPLAMLELFAASQHWASRGEQAEAAIAQAAARARLDVLGFLARTGSDPRDAGNDDFTLARFRELDTRVVELLMTTGWTAPLATVIDLFVRAPRRAWCAGLVWRSTAGLFALGDDGHPIDERGHPRELAPATPVWLVHVAEPDLGRALDGWRTWQHAQRRMPAAWQLERTAPAGELAALVDSTISIDALRTRGYRNGGRKNEIHQEERYVRTYLYRGTLHTVAVEPWQVRPIRYVPDRLPPVVTFEVARDLAVARTQ